MEIGLIQGLVQKQILSPQMIQSMEILVLSSQQLEDRIEQELEENVALELVDEGQSDDPGADGAAGDDGGTSATGPDASAGTAVEERDGDPSDASIDREIDLLRDRYEHLAEFQATERQNSPGPRVGSGGGEEDDKLEALQNTAGRTQSLQEFLLEQLSIRSALREYALRTPVGVDELPAEGTQGQADECASGASVAEPGGGARGEPAPAALAPAATSAGDLISSRPAPDDRDVAGEDEAGEGASSRATDDSSVGVPVGLASGEGSGDWAVAERTRTTAEEGRSHPPAAPGTSRRVALERLSDDEREERFRQLCCEIVYNLDGQGRLMYPLEDIHTALNTSPELNGAGTIDILNGPPVALPVGLIELRAALSLVQTLDPAGVGAEGQGIEGIKNCLLLQLDRDPGDYPLERRLIRDHFKDIGKNRLPQIAKATGRRIDEIKDAIDIIRTLNPLPGKEFEESPNAFVRPDVIIEEVEGRFKVRVEDSYIPRIRISSFYRELLEKSRKDPEIRKYVRTKIGNAEWLLGAIQQRKSTLLRVAEEVVEHQQEFFRNGLRALRPLKMQEIADRIGVNVSTVSRAISGKYFQAPGCIKELKSLFTGGTTKDDGSTESRDSVIMRIKDLLADEDPHKPYSDNQIVALLQKEGIKISRRTVTKYREAESIPSSRERKQF